MVGSRHRPLRWVGSKARGGASGLNDEFDDRYYCRFGLNPDYRSALEDAGLQAAAMDVTDGGVRILRLRDHPFFVLTLFVPQVQSQPDAPHPLVTSFLAAVSR